MIDENEMQQFPPEKPRKISEDLPENIGIISAEALVSKDGRDQYFVRFPKKVAEALRLKTGDTIEFTVTTKLSDAKPEDAELTVRLIRK